MNQTGTLTEDILIYKDEGFQVLGACFEVYKHMGRGFLEAVYQECLEMEFKKRSIPYKSQYAIGIKYDGISLNHTYVADFVCFDKIILEIKAVTRLTNEHSSQLMNYLRATGFKLGYVVNFGSFPKAEFVRYVN